VVLTLSRGVLLALAVTALWLCLVTGTVGGRLLRKVVAALLVGALALTALYQFNPETRQFFGTRFGDATAAERSDLVELALREVGDQPWLGFGAGVTPAGSPELVHGVHNTYVQQMVSFGVPLGSVVNLSLVAIAVLFFARARRTPVGKVLGLAVVGQLLIFLTQSSFEGTVLRVIFYLSLGLAAGLLRAHEAEAGGDLVSGPVSPGVPGSAPAAPGAPGR
jgi:O-antigen ligase